jgi:hypothetical protein
MRLRLLLKRLCERFLLENINHGEENEGIGRSRDLRGLGERGGGGTIKGMLWDSVVPRKLDNNNKDGMFTFNLMRVICL